MRGSDGRMSREWDLRICREDRHIVFRFCGGGVRVSALGVGACGGGGDEDGLGVIEFTRDELFLFVRDRGLRGESDDRERVSGEGFRGEYVEGGEF